MFAERFDGIDTRPIVEWFEMGGALQTADAEPAEELLEAVRDLQGLDAIVAEVTGDPEAPAPVRAAAVDFLLEGLYALKKISRSEDCGYHATESPRRQARTPMPEAFGDDLPLPRAGKKKYYN